MVDLGLRSHILPRRNYDLGFSLENVVYFELLRRGYQVNIGKVGSGEVDFVAQKQGTLTYFHVTADMTAQETFEREIKPLRAIGDTRAALLFLFLSLGYNLVCAWVLVAVLDLGIMGTALATATAQMLSSALCLLYIRKKRPFLLFGREDMRMDATLVRRTVSYAAVAALQQSSLYLGKLMVQGAVNDISPVDTAPISAFTAAGRVENFAQAFGIGGCDAMAIFIAQNLGAHQPRRALQGFVRGAAITVGTGVVLSAGMGLFAAPLAGLFLEPGPGMDLCVSYLRLISWFFLLSYFGNSFVGWFRGIGRMNITFLGTTLQIAIRVVATYLLVGNMGLDAVALATGLGWVAIVLFQITIFSLQMHKGIADPPAG